MSHSGQANSCELVLVMLGLVRGLLDVRSDLAGVLTVLLLFRKTLLRSLDGVCGV